mgnify:FL=1
METKQVTVQPAVGGMIKASKDSFVIPKEELKDFYGSVWNLGGLR